MVGQGRGSVWEQHFTLEFSDSFLAGVHQRTGWEEEQETITEASELFLYLLLLFSHKPNSQNKHYSIDTLTILIHLRIPQSNSLDGENVQFITFLYDHFIIFKDDPSVYY